MLSPLRLSEAIDDRARSQEVSEPSPKSQRIAAALQYIVIQVGAGKAVTKEGVEVPVEVNFDSVEEYREDLKLSEPIIWGTKEYPELAQKKSMHQQMNSMKEFSVYTEVPIEQRTEVQKRDAFGVRLVKRWKMDMGLSVRLVVQRLLPRCGKA